MAKKGKSKDGMVWDADTRAYYDEKIPRRSVKYWINNQHVGADDKEIADKLTDLIKRSDDCNKFTPDIVKATIRYALRIHKRNQDVFYAVASGKFRKR